MAIFATGFELGSSQYPSQFTQSQSPHDRRSETGSDKQEKTLWDWLTAEAAGFFTLFLVIVGGSQLVLFYVQLRLIRESLTDAHRPKLAIREPRIMWRAHTVNYLLENYGGSPAQIVESALNLQSIEGGSPHLPNFTGSNQDVPETWLAAGQSIRLNFTAPHNDEARGGDYYFLGRIAYTDKLG